MEGQLQSLRETLPHVGEDVIVHGESYRCLGFYGDDHQWHSSFSGQPLNLVKGWSRLSDDQVTPCQPC